MSEHLKVSVDAIYSEESDFSNPIFPSLNWVAYEDRIDELQVHRVQAVTGTTTSGTTLNLDHLTSGTRTLMMVKNHDPINRVNITCRLNNDADDCFLEVPHDGIAIVYIDPATDPIFVANNASLDCSVVIAQ